MQFITMFGHLMKIDEDFEIDVCFFRVGLDERQTEREIELKKGRERPG